eukprot:Seg5548.1 transcript_id=Seg5548.1/GoldUCD/mRNA.D3Y31 product=alpha-N-acetylgalactosaminidase protein_id=Seg5548.1/GoldUCD/D3Y31
MQKMLVVTAILLLAAPAAFALDNGLALTPPMGWLAWERFRCNTDCKTSPNDCISEKLFKDMADRMAADGYRDAGYTYVNIDDCWPEKSRDIKRNLIADKERFPSGMKELADYIHSKGLKIGIYTDFGSKTCGGYPGSIFDMQKDTNLFASWGIDMLKVDGCYSSLGLMADGYAAFGFYLNNTKRPILYSCSWPAYTTGHIKTDYKLIAKHCNIWRNYNDIQDSWKSVFDIINHYGKIQDTILPVVGPGNFNDPDMLIIGDFSLTQDQSKAQFAIWAILAAPLLMSNDLRKMKPWQSEILLNREIIAVNQDKLGRMGKRVAMTSKSQVWARPLVNETVAVVLFNTDTDSPLSISFTFKQVGFEYSKAVVRDLYQHKDMGVFQESYKAMVNPTGVVMVTLKPSKGKYSH